MQPKSKAAERAAYDKRGLAWMTGDVQSRENLAFSDGHETGWAMAEAHFAAEIERLTDALKRANAQAEHFEREWYLRGDEIERLSEPDHFWDADNPEHPAYMCEEEVAENMASDDLLEVAVQVLCAKSLPQRTMIITASGDDDSDFTWRWE